MSKPIKYDLFGIPAGPGTSFIQFRFCDDKGVAYGTKLKIMDGLSDHSLLQLIEELVKSSKETLSKLKGNGVVIVREKWNVHIHDVLAIKTAINYIEALRWVYIKK